MLLMRLTWMGMMVDHRAWLFVSTITAVHAGLLFRCFFRFVTMILKPDLHLRRRQAQGVSELISILGVEISTLVETFLQFHHLLLTEQDATFAFRSEGERMIGRFQRVGHRCGSGTLVHVVLRRTLSGQQTRHYEEERRSET